MNPCPGKSKDNISNSSLRVSVNGNQLCEEAPVPWISNSRVLSAPNF